MTKLKNLLLGTLILLAPASHQAALAQAPAAPATAAPASGPAYMVTYIEAKHAGKGKAATLLKSLAKASRAGDGNLRFDVLARRDRANQFSIVEVWRDQAAAEANLAAVHTKTFRDALAPLLATGYDQRPQLALAVGPVEADAGAGAGARAAAVYVVTHVDLIGPKKDEGIAALNKLAEPSRREAGALRYEALQQTSRLNHFTLVEVWKNLAALEAHEVAEHTLQYREGLTPMSGSLYDQRLYRVLQ